MEQHAEALQQNVPHLSRECAALSEPDSAVVFDVMCMRAWHTRCSEALRLRQVSDWLAGSQDPESYIAPQTTTLPQEADASLT